ncbi:hypothetical protein COLO4_03663 [Corchorus olitorius]|uniref:Uncharacterized protein n=1 Tax=Corchorus olitorius TaxID=93759 RepID=A0A1R3KXM6_9ROSI|nr:hypothetical protein COLO4_03663 [Corchorus olitorius]
MGPPLDTSRFCGTSQGELGLPAATGYSSLRSAAISRRNESFV